MTPYRDITDEEWQRVAPLLPELRPRAELRGRPLANTRAVLNGVLWVMYSGATWSAMPRRYPSYQTCHRRFQQWVRSGVMKGVLEALALDLKIRIALDVEEAFIDGRLCPGQKRGTKVGKTKRGKGTKIMVVADRHGLPVAVCVESATPHEVKLATTTLLQMIVPEAPKNLIGDTPMTPTDWTQNSRATESN